MSELSARTRGIVLLALSVGLSLALPAGADQVYRWVDANGVIHYTDEPPQKDLKPVELPPLQSISAQKIDSALPPPSGAPSRTASAASSSGLEVRLTAPKPDETIRGAERIVPVAVAFNRPLPEGARLVYLLDGNPMQTTSASSSELSGVDRGTHLVAVAVVDGSGKELARSAPVIVHVKPPIAR